MLRGAEETTAQLAFLFSATTPWQQAQALGAFPERHFQPRFSNLRAWEEREEGEGVPLWWLRAWASGWKVVGHWRP